MRRFTWLHGGAALLLTLLIVMILVPAIRAAREAARQSTCSCRLKQIALALQEYHDEYGSLPPPYLTDGNGRRTVSWRVLILPYIEQGDLYRQFHLSEPWNSPHNSKLTSQMPEIFECPRHVRSGGYSSFVAVVGKGTVWRASKPVSHDEIKDGMSVTVLVAETSDPVLWTEPRDIEVGSDFNASKLGKIVADHTKGEEGRLYSFVDGADQLLDLKPAELKPLLTIDGGEKVEYPLR